MSHGGQHHHTTCHTVVNTTCHTVVNTTCHTVVNTTCHTVVNTTCHTVVNTTCHTVVNTTTPQSHRCNNSHGRAAPQKWKPGAENDVLCCDWLKGRHNSSHNDVTWKFGLKAE
ncbi:hypothetical protein ACOMHN_054831 [Nucella lapillus]